jgi:hypothetical protein
MLDMPQRTASSVSYPELTLARWLYKKPQYLDNMKEGGTDDSKNLYSSVY